MSAVLITGGSGTLGRAYIRRALRDNALRRVVSLSRHEPKVAALNDEFGHFENFRAFIGDVRDRDRLKDACRGIDVVVMAAALKRVDTTCYNPDELFKTNVVGVDNTIRAAVDSGVRRIVLISSDKSVSASNPYGTSKAMAETLSIAANVWAYPRGCRISVVRYGNIIGSTSSVIPLWLAQAAQGGPLTLTHPLMTRFMMTIEQAVSLIEWVLAVANGGEIVVPVLPVAYMTDVAEAVASGVKLIETGLRSGGEKLAESLLTEEEASRTRIRGDYLTIIPGHHEWIKDDVWEGEPVGALARNYRSDNPGPLGNKRLTVDELRDLLASTEAIA